MIERVEKDVVNIKYSVMLRNNTRPEEIEVLESFVNYEEAANYFKIYTSLFSEKLINNMILIKKEFFLNQKGMKEQNITDKVDRVNELVTKLDPPKHK